jgi:phosphatidylinositol alpha-1,6-mannosyltransferase
MSAQQDVDVASPVPSGQGPVAGVKAPREREPGGDLVPGLDRRRIGAWYATFAGYAALLAVFSRHADQSWGIWASGGYLLAAITAVSYRGSRGRDAALLAGAAGALAGPLAWLAIRAPATADVQVVARAATLLLAHGSPYLGPGQLSAWRSYDPYLPAMTVFGLLRAAGLPGVTGDPRLWITLTCVALLTVAFGLAAPPQVQRVGRRRQALRRAVFAVTTPVLALPLAVGITDPPVLALFCVALACLAAGPAARGAAPWAAGLRALAVPHRIRPSRPAGAALAIGIACAMKITAWPALPVIAVMIAARDGRPAAWRFAAASALTAAAVIAAAAPAALAKPSVFLHNTVLYPLGLTRHLTPAASPLPGHLLAATGTAGHWAAICLLLVAGLAVAAWILLRRPADDRAAAWRLAAGLSVMFILAPATRWGYFAYPLGLLGWLGLTSRNRAVAGRLPAAASLTWLAPAAARLTPAMTRLLAAPGTNETATAPPRAPERPRRPRRPCPQDCRRPAIHRTLRPDAGRRSPAGRSAEEIVMPVPKIPGIHRGLPGPSTSSLSGSRPASDGPAREERSPCHARRCSRRASRRQGARGGPARTRPPARRQQAPARRLPMSRRPRPCPACRGGAWSRRPWPRCC